MHKKHLSVSGCLLLALSLIIPLASNGAYARLSGSRSPVASKSASVKSNSSPTAGNDERHDPSAMSQKEPLASGDKFLVAVGKASYYSNRFHGKKTAGGVQFDKNDFTAAHRSLPFGTVVRVTNLNNGKMVFVTINDRGPFIKNRIIDLSSAAARQLGLEDIGIGSVRIEAWN